MQQYVCAQIIQNSNKETIFAMILIKHCSGVDIFTPVPK